MRVPSIFLLVVAVVLSGCYTKPVVVQAIDSRAIEAVQAEIKRQVGIYLRKAKEPPKVFDFEGNEVVLNDKSFLCGKGLIGFDVSNIKAELTVTIEDIKDKKAGVSLPIRTVTLGATVEDKSDITNTEVLDYNLWVPPAKQDVLSNAVSDAELASAPIARAMIALRDAMVRSALKVDYSVPESERHERKPQPCFADFNPDKPSADAGNTYKISLSILYDKTNGITIDAGIVSFGASGETKSTTGNSLTVSFVQKNMEGLQALRDVVDTECKYPQNLSDECKYANAAVETDCKYPQAASKKCVDAKNAVGLTCKDHPGPSTKCKEAKAAYVKLLMEGAEGLSAF